MTRVHLAAVETMEQPRRSGDALLLCAGAREETAAGRCGRREVQGRHGAGCRHATADAEHGLVLDRDAGLRPTSGRAHQLALWRVFNGALGCGIQPGAQIDHSARGRLIASHAEDLERLVAEPRRDVTGHQGHEGL